MKGNVLLTVTALLLMSGGTVFSATESTAVSRFGKNVSHYWSTAWNNASSKFASARERFTSAWKSRPSISDLRNKVPSWQEIRTACAYRNIKEQIGNLPTTIKNHKVAAALVVATPIATYLGWKLWSAYKGAQCAKQK